MKLTATFLVLFVLVIVRVLVILLLELVFLIDGRSSCLQSMFGRCFFFLRNGVIPVVVPNILKLY